MLYQYYVVEIQRDANGNYGHMVYYEYDEDKVKAQRKGESKYYAVLSAAAVSGLPCHAAILFDSEGNPLMNKCYKNEIPQNTTEPETTGGEESE